MNKETIEKAAMEYATNATPSYINGDFDRYAIADSFERGAQWRINSVWHDSPEELPAPEETVMIEYIIDGERDYCFSHRSEHRAVVTDEYGFCFYVKDAKITRWAYIDDLLPDRKEATHD